MIKLLSAFGIGTIVSAIFVFIQSSKRNQLDYITKERSEWRKDIKSIIVDLLNGRNRKSAISRLKTQINPYGYDRNFKYSKDYYMNDGHIWDLLNNFTYKNKECEKLSRYLELLLKYDWERSKNEVRINNIYLWNILRWGLIILNTVMLLWAGQVDNRVNLYFALASVICLLLQKVVISWLSKLNFDLWKSKAVFFISFISMFLFPYVYSLFLIVILLNFYKLLKLTTFIDVLPIIFIAITISSEIFLLYQIFNLDQKYISQIKAINKSKTYLDMEYYKLYNQNYRLKEEIASNKIALNKKILMTLGRNKKD